MPTGSISRRRRWMVRPTSVVLLVPLVAMSATAPSSTARPSPAVSESRHGFQRVVVSTSQGRFDEGIDNQGWWSKTAFNTDRNVNYLVGEFASDRYRNFFTFRLPSLQRDVVGARLVLRRFKSEGGVTETLEFHKVRTAARRLNDNEGVDAEIYRDLGTGTQYGRYRVATERDPESSVGMWLNDKAIADINASRGRYFSIGGTLSSILGFPPDRHNESLFVSSGKRGVQELRLFVKEPPS